MNIIKFYLLLLLLTIAYGCNREGKIQHRIIERIEDCGGDKGCVVDLKMVTDFEWDTVYFSSGIPRLENIERAIGMRYDFYEEFTRPIIFIKNHKIVYYENCRGSIEGIVKNQIFIKSRSGSSISGIFTTQSAVFEASAGGKDGAKYYTLVNKEK